MPPRAWLLGLELLSSSLLGARPSLAQPKWVESYRAPESCPDQRWFETELSARLSEPGALGSVQAVVEARAGAFVGRVQPSGSTSEADVREVSHPSCEQVVRALALISALLLEQRARSPDTARSSDASQPDAPALASPRARRSSPASHSPKTGTWGQNSWQFVHGPRLALTTQTSIGPGLPLGPRLGYRLLAERGELQVELGLGLTRIQSGTIAVEAVGTAELTYIAGRLALCPAFRLATGLWLGPCGSLDVGELRGNGTVISQTTVTRASGWLSPGVLGKLEWRPVGRLFLELDVGAFFPLWRPEFYFSEEQTSVVERRIYRTPDGPGFSSDLGLGLLFP